MDETIINMDELTADEQVAILKKIMQPQTVTFNTDGTYQTVTFNTDGTLKLIDNVDQYLNNCQAATKAGLELKSRQVRFAISHFSRSLVDPQFTDHYIDSDVKHRKTLIAILEQLSDSINIRLEKYADLPEQPQKPAKKRTEPITYQWTKQPEAQLPKLYRRLIDGGFIDPETSSETFTACFTGQPVQSIPDKIKWLESKVLLAYFIDSLIKHGKIPKRNKWIIAEKVFHDATNLKISRANYTAYGEPVGYEKIDDILTSLTLTVINQT